MQNRHWDPSRLASQLTSLNFSTREMSFISHARALQAVCSWSAECIIVFFLPLMNLPALPETNPPWPPAVHSTFRILSDVYCKAKEMLDSENYSLHRATYHLGAVRRDAIPLLSVLEGWASEEDLLLGWIEEVSDLFLEVEEALTQAEDIARGQ